MRTLNVFRATMLFGLLAGAVFASTDGQTTPAQAAPSTPQEGGRRAQGPPLLPTPAVPAPPTPDKDGNFVSGLPYSPAPELTEKEGVPKGTVREFTMDSKDSKIYPGIARNQTGVVPYTRQVAV